MARAAAAVPVLSAEVSDLGKPEKVRTPPEAVPAVALRLMVARMLAMPVVPISRTPVPPMAVTTAVRRASLTA